MADEGNRTQWLLRNNPCVRGSPQARELSDAAAKELDSLTTRLRRLGREKKLACDTLRGAGFVFNAGAMAWRPSNDET